MPTPTVWTPITKLRVYYTNGKPYWRLQKKCMPPCLRHTNACFELLLHPVKAFTIIHQLYYAVAMNKKLAAANDSGANGWADKAKQLYISDSLLSREYH
ncbi:hypothetical protein, partial [Chitinophaga pinensis]|uniref:hypothetical protein n=1 Tax=Chitinophaga pinensis TaxID=79329 RepID=UPI0021BD2564